MDQQLLTRVEGTVQTHTDWLKNARSQSVSLQINLSRKIPETQGILTLNLSRQSRDNPPVDRYSVFNG